MADHDVIESRWSGNIIVVPDAAGGNGTSSSQAMPAPIYLTGQPGQIKHRPMPKRETPYRPVAVASASESAPVTPVSGSPSGAAEQPKQDPVALAPQVKLLLMGPQPGVVTWPRPQSGMPAEDNMEKRMQAMRKWRGAAGNSGVVLLPRDQVI